MHHHVVAGFLTTKHATSNPYRRHFLLFIDRLNVPRVTVQRTEVPLEMASRKGRREQKGFGKTTEAIVASFFRSRMQLTRSEFIFLHLTSFTKYPNPRCYELIHFTSVFFLCTTSIRREQVLRRVVREQVAFAVELVLAPTKLCLNTRNSA